MATGTRFPGCCWKPLRRNSARSRQTRAEQSGSGQGKNSKRACESLVTTPLVDERLEPAAKLLRQVLVANRGQQRQRRFVGFELSHAPRTFGEVVLEFCVNVGRQLVLDVVGQQAD